MIPITDDELRAACLEERYESRLAFPEVFPSAEQWKYIIEYKMGRLAERLYRKYLVAWLTPKSERTPFHTAAIENMPLYLDAIPRELAIKAVYGDVTSAPDATLALIDECRLFDAKTLSRLIDEGQNSFVADAVNAYQPEYADEDLLLMSDLAIMLQNLQPLGEVRTVRGLFRDETKYVCPNGHANSPDTEYCAEPDCGLDIFGLTEDQHKNISNYSHRVNVLRRLLDDKGTEFHAI
ncbi:MAG: hypothetical protein K2K84_00510 [Muribaculaceae bacterium]|nr:hypothetical protein [Muribaculaceae bacterium]